VSPTDLAVSDLDGREQTDHDAIRARVRDAVGQELLDEHAPSSRRGQSSTSA